MQLVEKGFHFVSDDKVHEGDYSGGVEYELVVEVLVSKPVVVS